MARFAFSVEDGIATLLLSNPPQNRLNGATSGDFRAGIAQVEADPSIRCLVIRAEGENFSYGGDISSWLEVDPDTIGAGITDGLKRLREFEELRVPVVSAVQGICLGGAFETVLRTDIIIAAEDAKFGHSEQSLGLITLMGGVQRVADRAGRGRALRWALTSERVPAREMLEAGVVTEVVPNDKLLETAYGWAKRLAKGPTLSHAAHKKMMAAWSNEGLAASDAVIPELAAELWRTEDARRGIASAQDAIRRGVERPVLDFDGR